MTGTKLKSFRVHLICYFIHISPLTIYIKLIGRKVVHCHNCQVSIWYVHLRLLIDVYMYEEWCLHTAYLVSSQNHRFGHPSAALLDQWQPIFCHLIAYYWSFGKEEEEVWSGSHGDSSLTLQGAYPIERCMLSDIIHNADHVSLG